MPHLAQALTFAAGLVGFFAFIVGLMLWLTRLEQTLHEPRRQRQPNNRLDRCTRPRLGGSLLPRLFQQP